jgi:hypothetical protein
VQHHLVGELDQLPDNEFKELFHAAKIFGLTELSMSLVEEKPTAAATLKEYLPQSTPRTQRYHEKDCDI